MKRIGIVIVLAMLLVVGLYAPVLAQVNGGNEHEGNENGGTENGGNENGGVVEPRRDKHNYITIILPDSKLKVERYGTMRYVDVDFNDGTWRIQIPKGVRIWDVKGGAARKLIVDENGDIGPRVWFMRGEPVVTRL